jgi:hypothetical protein
MAVEDFTTWTEDDPNSKITVTSSTITVTAFSRDQAGSWVYNDKGSNYFSGDFTHRFKFNKDTGTNFNIFYPWLITNSVDEPNDIDTANGDFQGLYIFQANAFTYHMCLQMCEGGTLKHAYGSCPNPIVFNEDTDYYITITRDDDGGVNSTGQLQVEVYTGNYSGELGAVEVGTETLDCSAGEQNDFQYIFAAAPERSSGALFLITADISDYNLAPSSAVLVDIVGTSAGQSTASGSMTGPVLIIGSSAGQGGSSGRVITVVGMAGTSAGQSSISAFISSGPLSPSKANRLTKRLVAAANNQLYYEDI